MSRYDDDYDDEDERDDDEEKDDEGVRRSTSNPFSERPNSVHGAGLPQRPPASPSGSVPSPIRSPNAMGGSNNPNNPGNRMSPGGNNSGSNNPANRMSPGGNSSGGSNNPNNPQNRQGNPPQGGGSSPSGAQPYQRSPLTRAPGGNNDDKDDDPADRSAAVNRVLGSFGQKLGGDSDSKNQGQQQRRDDQRSPSNSGGGGLLGSRLGGGGDRNDEKPANNPTYGSRLGGDPNNQNRSNQGGGLPSRLSGSGNSGNERRDEKPSGGLGGLTSRLPGGGGDKKDNKPSGVGIAAGLGGLASRLPGGGGGDKSNPKKDNKPAGGGIGGLGKSLGGLTSRLPGGGDKTDNKQGSSSSAFGSGSGSYGGQSPSPTRQQSPLGGTLSGGNKPQTSSAALGGASRSTYGGASTTRAPGTKAPAPSIGERLKGFNPFGKKDDRPAARGTRASKAPRVDQGGLSLDNKLDIAGIALLLGSLVLLLSSLSPSKGALTESINHGLSYTFGWGAAFVLMVTFAIGVWLILRHFGDEAPVISRTRLIGMAMLFLGVLVLAQFIDSFQYKVGSNQDYLGTLKTVFLPIAYSLGRGGGWIGGEIYFQLLSNFSEIGGFMIVIGWLIVALMLTLTLSASDLAMVVISNVRNVRDVIRQRQLRAAAERAAKQQTLAVATQQISVAKLAEALPAVVAGASPALPASTTGVDQRRIPITTGGRTSSVAFRAPNGLDGAEAAADGQPIEMPVPIALPVAQEKSGLFSRVRGVLPSGRPSEEKALVEKTAVDKSAVEKASALRSKLMGARAESAPAVAPVTAGIAASLSSPTGERTPAMQPVAEGETAPLQATNASGAPPMQETARLGDLLRQPSGQAPAATPTAAPGGVQPYTRAPLPRPDTTTPGERKLTENSTAPTPDAVRPPIPDLQSRMQALRQTPDVAKPAEVGRSSGVPAEVSRGASPAYGKPDTPAYAVPARSAPAGSSDVTPPPTPRRPTRNWRVPDLGGVLSSGIDQETDHEMLLKRAHIIEETLASFGAPGRVVDVRTGPVVTQFGVEPDYVPGRGGKKNRVKVGAIAELDKDLQLALGAKSIRIEAPVPGKGYVGIEVPNEKAETVHLRDVLESPEFKKIKSPLALALGQGVDGTPVASDLASMPHLLIAGTTGSGKSVLVNAIIAGLLLNNTPRQLKFIMVDPKRVELTQYNGVPHLIAPVVVELERTVSVLKWVTREMDERYRKFSNAAARNIEDYNKHLPATDEPMPYIVVIIDELADLMMLAPDETERVITRIAALARATGIHLVIATQRPSVDVVTGLIKANFPARVAFAVAANTDSRVILDQPGAEKLLGRGDMLYMSGDAPAPVRLQGVYVSDNEIGNITRFWRSQMTEEDLIAASRPIGASISPDGSSRNESGSVVMKNSAPARPHSQEAFWDEDDDDSDDEDDEGVDGEDELYEQSVEMVRRLNKASVSLLQRRLRIGYTRAARLIDMMEERGIVGPATEGSKPREVLPVR